jgi:hypothetical protein
VDLVEPQLIDDRVERFYMLRGQPSGYDSTLDEDHEAPNTAVGLRIHSFISREERESLLRTDKRLRWCDQTDAQSGVDCPRSSRFRITIRRMSSCSSFVQVLRMASDSEGDATENSVMGLDDGDGNKYIPL